MASNPAVLRTNIYVDGFNLYYRALKDTPHKWLDLKALFQSVLRPANTIRRIRYFTADISGKRDPGAQVRQQAYLRAIKRTPEVSVHKGRFLASTKWARIASPPPTFIKPDPVTVMIEKTEEKGSDVNLASFLLLDAFRDDYDVAVVVSNDTDLVEPIRMAKVELGKVVGLMCPAKSPARSLTAIASFCRFLTPARLGAAQFPDRIPGTSIRKPAVW
jgi:uncharacterized LabA/DUF88 family protein